MYDIALECLKGLRDRERVKSFINFIPVLKHYEFRAKVDALLTNSVSSSTISYAWLTHCDCPVSKSSGGDVTTLEDTQDYDFFPFFVV